MEIGVVTEFFHVPLSQRVPVAIDITAKVAHVLFIDGRSIDYGLSHNSWHHQHRPRPGFPVAVGP